MSFRLLRVKRRADQDPAAALYLPIEDDSKRTKIDSNEKEFRIFKIIERGDRTPIKIIKPTERDSCIESKVVLLSDSMDVSSVAEAILIDNQSPSSKHEISQLIKNNNLFNKFDSFNVNEDSDGFVYDVYRLDLGKFTAKDIETRSNCIQIVTYEQEFLHEEDGSESETFEDDSDSNAEDYYANDYPDEESYLSEVDEDNFDYDDDEDDGFIFNESFEIEDVGADSDTDFVPDINSDDYDCVDDHSFGSDDEFTCETEDEY